MKKNSVLNEKAFRKDRKRFDEILKYSYDAGKLMVEAEGDEEPSPTLGEPENNDELRGKAEIPNEAMPANGQPAPTPTPTPAPTSDLGNVSEPTAPSAPVEDTVDVQIDEPTEDDEVINVDDLTKSQEVTEYKVDCVNEKIINLLNIAVVFQKAVEKNYEAIQDVKAELAKRLPTEEEKIAKRSQQSYPFNQTSNDYIKDMEQNKQEDLVIRKDDVDAGDNNFSIYKSLGGTLPDIPTNLKGYFA